MAIGQLREDGAKAKDHGTHKTMFVVMRAGCLAVAVCYAREDADALATIIGDSAIQEVPVVTFQRDKTYH